MSLIAKTRGGWHQQTAMGGPFGLLGGLALGVLKKGYTALDRSLKGALPGGVPMGGLTTSSTPSVPMVPPPGPGTRYPPVPVPQPQGPGIPRVGGVQMLPQATTTENGMPSSRHMIRWIQNEPVQPKGYIRNRSSYYRRDPSTGQTIHVPAGTVWVRRRRRNALNQRALRRSIARVKSAKKWQKEIARVTVREKNPKPKTRRRKTTHAKGCECVVCKRS